MRQENTNDVINSIRIGLEFNNFALFERAM